MTYEELRAAERDADRADADLANITSAIKDCEAALATLQTLANYDNAAYALDLLEDVILPALRTDLDIIEYIAAGPEEEYEHMERQALRRKL